VAAVAAVLTSPTLAGAQAQPPDLLPAQQPPLAMAPAQSLGAAQAQDLSAAAVLGPRPGFRIESVALQTTYYDQRGHGFQSQAGPPEGPGSEELTVWQPQLEVVARQGDRFLHRLTVPVDIVTAASPDAVDATTSASRIDEAGSIEIATTYQADARTQLFVHPGFHLEEQMRSWHFGFGMARSLADDNALLSVSFDQAADWLDVFTIHGVRVGRALRSTSNANVGLTQILSPTTVAMINYGLTVQTGELGNTWNSVPLAGGDRDAELLPRIRQRHALVGRAAQYLPWDGALHAYYRFYADDWGILAHTLEGELDQRLSPWLYLRARYRYHHQEGASFYADHPLPTAFLRTSDSDLAPLSAHTVGGRVVCDLPVGRTGSMLRLELGYERYFRSNDLDIDIYTAAVGLRL
jgi:hypothetical protein